MIAILKPVGVWLQKFQSNDVNISSVPEAFMKIENYFYDQLENSDLSLLTGDETNRVLEHLENRKSMAVKKIHLAANILDPVFKGQRLDAESHKNGK